MKRFFKDKRKLMIFTIFILVVLAACSSPRDPNTGQVYPEKLIGIDTTFGSQLNQGWFDGIIVWPIAQLINVIAQATDAGIGIIIVTLLLQFATAAFSIKSQVSAQRMQMLQPEMQRIQNKYAGKTDDRSRMMQAQELQQIYAKNNINPFGTILTTFLQFPLILGVYQATQRAQEVVEGSFLNIKLTETPIWGMENGQWVYILIFLLMIVFQFASLKFPQWLQKQRDKNNHVKKKEYADPKNNKNNMAGSMNMMMYGSLGMIAIFAINWPLSMSFYWLVSSIARIIQDIVINKFFINDEK